MRLDSYVLGLWLSWAAPDVSLDLGGLTVETGSPDALCPELTRTREAVNRRLGALEVQGGPGWRARYTIGHAPEGEIRDFVRLQLFDPQGMLRLSRDLPIAGDSCSAMADAIALVLDRYFRSLDPERHELLPVKPPAPAQPSPQEPATSAPEPVAEPARAAAPPSPVAAKVPAAGFLAAEVGLMSRPSSPTGGIRLFSELYGPLGFGAAVSLAANEHSEQAPFGGQVESTVTSFRVLVGWSPRLGKLRPYVGPGAVLLLERGTSSGLENEQDHVRALWGLGLAAGIAVELGSPWVFTASVAGEAMIPGWGGTFEVQGEEVLRPPVALGWAGIGVGYAFSL